MKGFLGSSAGKESACNAEEPSLIPGLGRSPGEGIGYSLQQSCLENSMDRVAWRATVHGVTKSQTRLSDFTHFTHSLTRTCREGNRGKDLASDTHLNNLKPPSLTQNIEFLLQRNNHSPSGFCVFCFNLKVKVTQSYPTLFNPMDYTVHGILQARILEWVAFLFWRGSSQPRNQTGVFCTAGGFFTSWGTRGALVRGTLPQFYVYHIGFN